MVGDGLDTFGAPDSYSVAAIRLGSRGCTTLGEWDQIVAESSRAEVAVTTSDIGRIYIKESRAVP